MYVPLDRESSEPLPRQIAIYFEELIRRGHVARGARLPSLRVLARTLGVARETVEAAYEDLATRALVQIIPGRGAVVRRSIPASVELALPFPEPRARDPLPASAWRDLGSQRTTSSTVYDFRGESALPAFHPASTLRSFLRKALESRGPLAGSPPFGGELALREAASRTFAASGVLRPVDEIAIFPGVVDAVRAIVALFVPPKGLVLADGLLEPRIFRAVRAEGARAVVLALDGEHALRRARAMKPRLLVVSSRHDALPRSPMDPAPHRALLDLAREEGIAILEDLTRSAVAPIASDPPPLAVLDRSGRVSSILDLAGEIGGGFEACALATTAKAIERLRGRPLARAHPLDRVAQRMIAQALDSPARVRAHRRVHESRTLLSDSIARGIRRRLPGIRKHVFSEDARSVRLDLDGTPPGTLAALAERRGVRILVPGDLGAPSSEDDFVLLDLTRHEEGDLLEGIRLLGEALDEARREGAAFNARSPEREAAPS
jgi:GntR family transcriptional regulator/MocR family aminotransferase